MDRKEKSGYTLEQRLFHALHERRQTPSIKEFNECFAFQNSVRSAFASKRNPKVEWDIVIDVAGGHGALGGMFLVCTSAKKAVVIDPALVGGGGVEWAWKSTFFPGKDLVYRTECLRTGLPSELSAALSVTSPKRVLVVACHACQHLSTETLDIAAAYGVHVAVMPCCQRDLSTGGSWKQVSKNLSIPFAPVMDILLAGKMMANPNYKVRMKVIDSKITPQNRIIICQAMDSRKEAVESASKDLAHERLSRAYEKAHGESMKGVRQPLSNKVYHMASRLAMPAVYVAIGCCIGALIYPSSLQKMALPEK